MIESGLEGNQGT